MWPFILSTLRAGQRGRSIQGVLILGVALVAVAYLSSSFSPRQPMTVALDVGLSGLRFSLVLLALFVVQDMVGREIDRKTVFISCTYPVPRGVWLLGRYAGTALLLLFATILLALMLWGVVLLSSGGYEQRFPPNLGFPFWAAVFAVWLDAMVVAAFALCVAAVSTVSILPLAMGVAFAIAARGIGPALQYINDPTNARPGDAGMRSAPVLESVQWLLPDLSRLDWRIWPMYGVDLPAGTLLSGLGIGFSAIVILLALAVFAFRRREFE